MGKGSVFALTVPLAPADKRAIEASIVPRAQPSLSYDKLVLVIDDDPLVLEGMSGIFRKWGCRVITADSDSKALKAATEQDDLPDLIISDYHLADGPHRYCDHRMAARRIVGANSCFSHQRRYRSGDAA